MEAARHELCFSMNPDVVVRAGFLEPLIECLDDPATAAAVPKVLLNGDEDRIESLVTLELVDGMLEIAQPGLEVGPKAGATTARSVAFAVGGACLLRKAEFLKGGGFDPLFEPFYWEDVDWCWSQWRAGRKSVYVPASIVEHHHRGTIGRLVPSELVRAALEKNRLLFHWKYIDDPELLQTHIAALYRLVFEAWLEERREDLVWLNLALHQTAEVLKTRNSLPASKLAFGEVYAVARPVPLEVPKMPASPKAKKAARKRSTKRRKD
jgi:GT2 family glycosyltransferase